MLDSVLELPHFLITEALSLYYNPGAHQRFGNSIVEIAAQIRVYL